MPSADPIAISKERPLPGLQQGNSRRLEPRAGERGQAVSSAVIHQVGNIEAEPVRCYLCGKFLTDSIDILQWKKGQSVYVIEGEHGGRETGPSSEPPDCSVQPHWVEDIIQRLDRIEKAISTTERSTDGE